MKGTMTKINSIIIVFVFCFFCACDKDRVMYKQPNFESVNSSVLCYQSIYDIVRICDGISAQSAFTGTAQPVTYTKDSLNGFINGHLNFNDTLTLNSDGRKRSGKIDVTFKKPYFTISSNFEVTLKNYNVNGNIFNGTFSYTILYSNLNGKYFRVNCSGLSIVSNTSSYKINSNVTINTLSFYSSYVKGSVNGTGNLFDYQSNTIDSLYITSRYFYKSKFSLKSKDFDAVINYGDGQNDTLATATSEKFRYIINLKVF